MRARDRSVSSGATVRGQARRAGQAVAHGAASFLGFGGMPWLATYLIVRDLIERLIDPWLSIKR